MLPYRYTAASSIADAGELAGHLGIRYEVLPIAEAVTGFETILSGIFKNLPPDITEENLQARTRGTLLMAISNKTGLMVVTTGNKSEMSVGYATLYGDMNGGFNPIKDIYKTQVFRLAALRNHWKPDGALGPAGEVIPPDIITRPPTAELRENQTDQDSLPPYDVLDAILERLIEREEPLEQDHRRRLRPRDGHPHRSSAQRRRIQAPPGRARREGDAPGISAATAAIPSPTAFATRASRCLRRTRRWSRAAARRRSTRSRADASRAAGQAMAPHRCHHPRGRMIQYSVAGIVGTDC